MPQVKVTPTGVFLERLEAYMKDAGIKTHARAIMELAAAGLLHEGYYEGIQTAVNPHGGKRKGAGRKKKVIASIEAESE